MKKKSSKLSNGHWGLHAETMVSIVVAVYNHEKFLPKMLEGFLMQEVNFNVEILINDDVSTDDSALILKTYEEKHPTLFNNFYQETNQYSQGVKPWFHILIPAAKGKYIALCDGDDYWTDPLKLQKQVDFLEANEDVNIVHTDFDWLHEKTGQISPNFYQNSGVSFVEKYGIKEFFLNPKMRTLTLCFRKSAVDDITEVLNPKWTVGDTALILHVVKDKQIGFINESMGVYRRGIGTASVLVNPEKRFFYFENGPSAIKHFFYQHYGINDRQIEQKLKSDYYDGVFKVALPARKYTLYFKAVWNKICRMKFSLNEVRLSLKQLWTIGRQTISSQGKVNKRI